MYNLKEYLKCKNDPIYFIENYIKIFNQSFGVVPFKMFDKQKEFIKLFLEKHKILVLKSRQTGMTTTLQQLQLWLQMFFERYYIGVLSIEQEKQNNFLREIVEMYEISELWKLPWTKLVQPLQKRLMFSNHSEIRQGNTNNPMRSFRMSLVIVDEQQFIDNLDAQLKSIGPTLQTIQKSGLPWGIILNSTPNGVNNYYYQIYYNQINNPDGNGYTVFKFHWKDVPYYDDVWYKEQCEILGWDYLQIQQELELKFLTDSDTFLEPKVLESLKEMEPIKVLNIENIDVEIFEEPTESDIYYFGVDVQSGMGQDYSQGVVINSEGRVCQVFNDKHQDDIELQKVIYQIGKMYNYQKLGVEVTGGYGLQVVRRLTGYPNFFKMKKRENSSEYITGILTNQQTRPLILKQLYDYVSEFPENVRSKKIINELLTLVYKNGKVQQKNGFNDDLQMQLQFQYFIRNSSIESNKTKVIGDYNMLDFIKNVSIREKVNLDTKNKNITEIIEPVGGQNLELDKNENNNLTKPIDKLSILKRI